MAINIGQLLDVPGGPGVTGSVKQGSGITISTTTGQVDADQNQYCQRIIAGTGIEIDPPSGIGEVTITAPTPTLTAGDLLPIGTVMLFYQATAPTNWQTVDQGTRLLRVVSSTGAGTGGSQSWTSVFTTQTFTGSVSLSGGRISGSTNTVSQTPSGSVSLSGLSLASTTISEAQMPSHTHTFQNRPGVANNQGGSASQIDNNQPSVTGATGGNSGHSHSLSGSGSFSGSSMSHSHNVSGNLGGSGTFTGGSFSFDVQYIDLIMCSKVANPPGVV